MTKYRVDVYADTICPWCYINKRSIDTAIKNHQAQHPEDEFDVVWRPYMLYPNAKVSAYNKKDSFLLKFGPSAPDVLDRVQRVGSSHGLTFTWEGRTGSTRDSHKLILLAASQDASSSNHTPSPPLSPPPTTSGDSPPLGPCAIPTSHDVDPRPESVDVNPRPAQHDGLTTHPLTSKQNAVTEAILSGALTRNQDISSREFLVPIALAHGLAGTAEDVLRYLDSEEANARVDAEMARARVEIGVTAVPSVVVNGRYRVGGMQEPGVFGGLFERIRAR
jgi:predicted DsbA family dithiol-disulfide isomerase